jgi:hypothetical protein
VLKWKREPEMKRQDNNSVKRKGQTFISASEMSNEDPVLLITYSAVFSY